MERKKILTLLKNHKRQLKKFGVRSISMFGSMARNQASKRSDVDLLVISDALEYAELFEVLSGAEAEIGRRIEPVLVTRAQWEERRRASDSFANRVMSGERITVIPKHDDAE